MTPDIRQIWIRGQMWVSLSRMRLTDEDEHRFVMACPVGPRWQSELSLFYLIRALIYYNFYFIASGDSF